MKKLLFLGDSITDCGHAFDYEDLGEGYVRMILNVLRQQGDRSKVYNRGTDGFTVANVKRFWNFHHTKIKPDLITILVGINDVAVMKYNALPTDQAFADFEQTYDSLLMQIRETYEGPIVLMEPFIFPHPAEFASWEAEVREMSQIIQRLAEKHQLVFLPLWDKLLTAAQKNGYDTITLDGIHLTRQGHKIIADTWLAHYMNK